MHAKAQVAELRAERRVVVRGTAVRALEMREGRRDARARGGREVSGTRSDEAADGSSGFAARTLDDARLPSLFDAPEAEATPPLETFFRWPFAILVPRPAV